MGGEEFAARVASSGTVLGLSAGVPTAEFDAALAGIEYLEEPGTGRRKSSILRRDYGLLEATFRKDGADWRCDSIIVEFHRLLTDNKLTFEWEPIVGERFSTAPRWDVVEKILTEVAPPESWVSGGCDNDFRLFGFPNSYVMAHVLVSDEESLDPGDPDQLWSLEILSPSSWSSMWDARYRSSPAINV
ncbi:hypothetical protein [Jidongwangia harbinensis]|uniref:hypothetical protein n=1 Tax=Jidongwangia harbinensis TaxID=2878561 RepID=UPI001CD94BCF|nr:hypothetical protein [Jidongwangia harbinensis]MCA2217994.1 hypothetical protein [Jidongwangia harbinensis]